MSTRNRFLPILLVLCGSALLAACGGGSSPPSTGTGRVAGRLLVPDLQAAPQTAVPVSRDLPPPRDGSTIASAAALPFDGEAMLQLDAQAEEASLRVLRVVAERAALLSARCEPSAGLRVRFALHHLDRGVSGRALDVVPGDVIDIVVWAVEGRGRVRVRLAAAALAERAEAQPPESYRGAADAHRDGELVVRMRDGRGWQTLDDAVDYECVEAAGGWCRLRLRAVLRGDRAGFDDLTAMLARVERMRRGGRVAAAEPNYLRRLQATPDDPRFDDQWALEQIRAPAAWEFDRGEEQTVVATVDSGVKQGHPDLAGRLLPGYDFLDDDADPEDPRTGYSHGTQTAGIIAAATNNGEGVAGVLWNGRIMPLRAFDTRGFGDSFDIAQAILYAAGLSNTSGQLPASPARVINASFAADSRTSVEEDACDAARDAGVLIVAASGNIGSSRPHYPAAYSSVMGVGATTIAGVRAVYSNYGDWIDLVAPGGTTGQGILAPSVDASGSYNYQSVNGTSFASPHAAGVAALVLGVRDYSPAALRSLLRATAQDIGAPGADLFTGAGIVHAYEAVRTALEVPGEWLMPGELVTVRLVRLSDGRTVSSTTTTEASQLGFDLEALPPGGYRLEAGTDRDFDGEIDDAGEMYGVWTDGTGSERLDLADGEVLTDLEFTLTLRA